MTSQSNGERVSGLDQQAESHHQVRERARASLGLGLAAAGHQGSLRASVRRSGAGWYRLMALSVLVMVDEISGFAFLVLGPEISQTLGIGKSSLAAIMALKLLAITLAMLPMAAYVQHRPRRALVSIVAAFAWSMAAIATGFVTSIWALIGVLLLDGASSGSVRAVHPPLLMDSYPPDARVRAFSWYRGADSLGNILSPLIVASVVIAAGMTWRGVFVAMGVVSLLGAFLSLRLRDPGYGAYDVETAIRKQLRGHTNGQQEDGEVPQLTFFEIVRRILLVESARRILVAFAVIGMLLVPLFTFLFFFLEETWGLGPGQRALFFAVIPIAQLAALSFFGPRAERLFADDPGRFVRMTAWILVASVTTLAAGIYAPVFLAMGALVAIALALFSLLQPSLNVVLLTLVHPQMRPHAAALAGIFLAAVGGFGGLILMGGIDRRFGTAGAIASLAIPGYVAAYLLRRISERVQVDLDHLVDEVIDEEEVRASQAAGERPPLLSCRHINFSYGQLQVLFDVDFTVDEGEMVALLGTNGAGKSTLLKVISGLGYPSGGSVRLRGAEITYLEPDRRVGLGISQVPGGRAVFPPLSVLDNLRVYAYTQARDRQAVDRGIDASFEAFPRLYERRHEVAATLSGGEQQMLALSKALILKPRLLLIDELSLGLAPKIIGELLPMVRQINAEGTAIVLVEQSVNIALSVANHAYFMEKGEIRFDGRTADLMERGDLLRSVFLEGASKGIAGVSR